ncbi:hypothetical protein JHK86_052597 [Glycine max]|nr:hypothetical protein JHK86_052597 [Glycine max]
MLRSGGGIPLLVALSASSGTKPESVTEPTTPAPSPATAEEETTPAQTPQPSPPSTPAPEEAISEPSPALDLNEDQSQEEQDESVCRTARAQNSRAATYLFGEKSPRSIKEEQLVH